MKDLIPPPSSDDPVPPSEPHFVLDTAADPNREEEEGDGGRRYAPAEDGEPQLQFVDPVTETHFVLDSATAADPNLLPPPTTQSPKPTSSDDTAADPKLLLRRHRGRSQSPPYSEDPVPKTHFVLDSATAADPNPQEEEGNGGRRYAPAEDGEPQLQSPARRIIHPIPNSFHLRFYENDIRNYCGDDYWSANNWGDYYWSAYYWGGIRHYWGDDEPDEPGTEISVESFGAAVLAAYGWSQGKGIGRNNKVGDIKVHQYERRSYRAGLGYFPSPNTGTSASSNDLNNTGGK